jgi:four helix bundle protein
MEEFGYERLDAWQVAMELTEAIYTRTKDFPKEEVFGITRQMRNAASSIPYNIAEGYSFGPKGFSHHLKIARGSSFELRTQIEISRRLGYLTDDDATVLRQQAVRSSQLITGLLRSIDAGENHNG